MPSSTQPKQHLLFVDSLRALAALYVMIHHATLQYFGFDNDLTGFAKLSIKAFKYGHSAVDLFIVLSGFSLMLSVTKNSYRLKGGILLFLKRRAIRILPPYYFAVVLSLLLIWLLIGKPTGSHWDVSLPVTLGAVFTHVFLIHDFLASTMPKINHSLWSISVEFRIYLFFPLLIWIRSKYGVLSPLLASTVISLIGLIVLFIGYHYNHNVLLNYSGVSPYIILFSMGMLAADLSFATAGTAVKARTVFSNLSIKNWCLIVLAIAVLLVPVNLLFNMPLLSEHHLRRNLMTDINDIFLGLLFAVIICMCSTTTSTNKISYWLVKKLSWQPLVLLGTFSYSLYLIHAPLLQVITQYLLAPVHISAFLSCWLLIVFGTPVIILLSYLFFILFERPFLTLGKKHSMAAAEIKAIVDPAP